MAEQAARLKGFQQRLAAIDDSQWPVSERVDYMLVLAEMRGLEFQHRVSRPWQRDPAFYSTTNLGFGPKIHGAMAIPKLPLSAEDAASYRVKLAAVPKILEQARSNLTDARGDLARLAIVQKKIERNVYDQLARDLARSNPSLRREAVRARDATDKFLAWLEQTEAQLPPHGGIGREEYDWYLKHVLLFPYTWEEMRVIAQREYERSLTFLKIEEHRHRGAPMIEPATTLDEFERRRAEADADLLRFLRDEQIMTVPDWLVPPVGEGPYVLPTDRDPPTRVRSPSPSSVTSSARPRTAIRARCALTTCPAICSISCRPSATSAPSAARACCTSSAARARRAGRSISKSSFSRPASSTTVRRRARSTTSCRRSVRRACCRS